MNTKEQIEAALKQARANRDEAAAKRTKAGTEWRSIQEDPTATYPKVRSAWALADAEWNMANALIDKLTAQLKELEQIALAERAVLEMKRERDHAAQSVEATFREALEQLTATAQQLSGVRSKFDGVITMVKKQQEALAAYTARAAGANKKDDVAS